jgi:hypothetical protein
LNPPIPTIYTSPNENDIVQIHVSTLLSISEYNLLTPSTPLGSTITHRKIIGSSCPDNMHIPNDNEAFHKVLSFCDRPPTRRREHKLFHTLHLSWIHHYPKKNDWILLF